MDSLTFNPLEASESFLEIVFEDILQVQPWTEKEIIPDIFYDDYRTLSFMVALMPAILFM